MEKWHWNETGGFILVSVAPPRRLRRVIDRGNLKLPWTNREEDSDGEEMRCGFVSRGVQHV